MAKLFLIILFVLAVLGCVYIVCRVFYLIGNAKGFSDGYKAGQKGGLE